MANSIRLVENYIKSAGIYRSFILLLEEIFRNA
jgi:hypothetical protein